MANDRLLKMYLFGEESFKKMKERLAEQKNFNDLDKAMNRVLTQKMSTNQKWLLYRHELQKFLNLRRRMMGEHPEPTVITPAKKRRNFYLPTRKIKTHNLSTDTDDLPQYITVKKNKDVQTEPDLRSRTTQTKIPIKFNQSAQVQPVTNEMQTDTADLPPPENYLSLSMLDEDFEQPAQSRLSSASVATRLIKNNSTHDADELFFNEPNQLQIMEIFGNKYYIPLEDRNDFEDYSAEFHKTHKEGDEMDIDLFNEWQQLRHQKQDALVQSPAPTTL